MKEAFCLASGPSLCAEDVATVANWRNCPDRTDRGVIVVNTTFRMAPWADYLFAMDRRWWKVHGMEAGLFRGEKYAIFSQQRDFNIKVLRHPALETFGNSGAGAISLAIRKGARRIYLLGYDCQHTQGRTHWHGDHPKQLGNAGSMTKWPAQFERIAEVAREQGVEIINCTRETALRAFPKAHLHEIFL